MTTDDGALDAGDDVQRDKITCTLIGYLSANSATELAVTFGSEPIAA